MFILDIMIKLLHVFFSIGNCLENFIQIKPLNDREGREKEKLNKKAKKKHGENLEKR